MPGIAGIISPTPVAETRRKVESMLERMVHEPFHRSGAYFNEQLGVGAGWVCEQGTFSDCLPLWNEKRDICLLFVGENFPEPAEVSHLKEKGHQFEAGNASYLVHLYEEFGPKFLERLNGLFSGLIVDLRERKALLFNDRYGMNRVYYHENENGFYFASEAKSLLKILPALREMDLRSVGEFFSCGCVLQNRTLFKNVSLLPGGAAWTFSLGQPPRKEEYFRKETWEQQPVLSPEEYYQRLKETWAKILPRYFQGNIGLSLTGGLDSRLILAWAPRPRGELPCYTFGGMYRDCADLEVAREVAGICGQPHRTIPLDRQFLSEFPALVEKTVYMTDGTLDPTGAADLYVQRLARQAAPVRVTGLYGGEILRSIFVFRPTSFGQDLLAPEMTSFLADAARTYGQETQGPRLSFIAFKQAAWFIYARLAVERSQLTLRSPYFDNDLIALAFQAPPSLESSKEIGLRLIAEGNPALQAIGTDRGLSLHSIPGVTRARHLFQEFTFKAEYAYDYGMPQWLARVDRVFSPLHFERLFLGRHKFYHFRLWYRRELARYVKEVLLDPRALSRSYLRGDSLQMMVTRHTSGTGNYTSQIHRALTLELIQRQLLEQN